MPPPVQPLPQLLERSLEEADAADAAAAALTDGGNVEPPPQPLDVHIRPVGNLQELQAVAQLRAEAYYAVSQASGSHCHSVAVG